MMSCIARKLSVLALLVLPALPACDPADEFDADFDDAGLSDEEIEARYFDPGTGFDPNVDIDFFPTIDLSKLPILDIHDLSVNQAWVSGHNSQIVVTEESGTAYMHAYQVDLDTGEILALRRAAGRSVNWKNGLIPLRSTVGLSMIKVDPAQKDYMIQRQVSFAEFGGNFHLPPPKVGPRGNDLLFKAKIFVMAVSANKAYF